MGFDGIVAHQPLVLQSGKPLYVQ